MQKRLCGEDVSAAPWLRFGHAKKRTADEARDADTFLDSCMQTGDSANRKDRVLGWVHKPSMIHGSNGGRKQFTEGLGLEAVPTWETPAPATTRAGTAREEGDALTRLAAETERIHAANAEKVTTGLRNDAVHKCVKNLKVRCHAQRVHARPLVHLHRPLPCLYHASTMPCTMLACTRR